MKHRADSLLALKGLAKSREQAQRLIMAGQVYVDEVKVLKASLMLPEDAPLIVRGGEKPFASRGGQKIEQALRHFDVDVAGLVCMDIGAAAGGFTDALLRRGASLVYAIDVGYGQLDWALRQDERVVVMERCNARQLTADQFHRVPSLCVMDVSFISIRLILPAAAVMGDAGRFLCLVKPQFEAGRDQVGKHGVVRDAAVHRRVLMDLRDFCPGIGLSLRGLHYSPVKGPKGNIEFLADIRPGECAAPDDAAFQSVVSEAHHALD